MLVTARLPFFCLFWCAGVQSLTQLQTLLVTEQQKAEQARQHQQQREVEEKQRQRQQQEAKVSGVKKKKGFSLESVVIQSRQEERHDIII